MPALDGVRRVIKIRHAQHKICPNELVVVNAMIVRRERWTNVINCSHGDDTRTHEPACHVGHGSGSFGRSQDCDPGILAAGNRICRAHLGEAGPNQYGFSQFERLTSLPISHTERKRADSQPAPNHDRWSPTLNADNQDASQGGPASHDGERKADHADETEIAPELCSQVSWWLE